MRNLYREKIYKCGKYLEVSLYPVYKKAGCRKRKAKPTPEMMKKVNDINAQNKMIRICNANFTADDYKLCLTYRNNPRSEEEAARELRNFLRRLKNYRKRRRLSDLKYVAVTERGTRNGRYHHHLIISGGVDPKEIVRIWGLGYVQCDPLQFSENGIADLSRYMMKRAVASKKRWNASKNLIHPQAKIRDGRISKKNVTELARDTDNAREFEKYYSGYNFSEAHVVYNDVNGGVYIYARFYEREDKNAVRSKAKRKP